MTIVRVVRWPGGVPEGSIVTGRDLIVLADDTGHRAVPLWLRVPKHLWRLLDRPGEAADDTVLMAGVLQETAAQVLQAAGVRVTAVDIEPAGEDVRELRSGTAAARAMLATANGPQHVRVSAVYRAGAGSRGRAPVRVADAVLDRLAVPSRARTCWHRFCPRRPPRRRVIPDCGGVPNRGTWRLPTA